MSTTNKNRKEVIVHIPGSAMTNFDILYYVDKIPIPNFVGVFMRDQLPKSWDRNVSQFGVMNLNTSNQIGVHWVSWGCIPHMGVFYFDSFGQDIPIELLKYLKTKKEMLNDKAVIQRNIHVVQTLHSSECGRLSLYVLKCLSENISFDKIIQVLKVRYDNNIVNR